MLWELQYRLVTQTKERLLGLGGGMCSLSARSCSPRPNGALTHLSSRKIPSLADQRALRVTLSLLSPWSGARGYVWSTQSLIRPLSKHTIRGQAEVTYRQTHGSLCFPHKRDPQDKISPPKKICGQQISHECGGTGINTGSRFTPHGQGLVFLFGVERSP